MKISIITLFPEIFLPVFNSSILGRAQKKGKVAFEMINLRDFGQGRHKTVDDKPYGGRVGMVLKVDVLAKALNSAARVQSPESRVILMSASGKTFNQTKAKSLSKRKQLIIVCGHYEGVDQRFIDKYIDEEISIGDYILTGGEIPAMAVIDSLTRLLPGVLEKPEATKKESFENGLLEHPQYTRPETFKGMKVPKVLLSGNHAKIANWQDEKSRQKTNKVRPDLLG